MKIRWIIFTAVVVFVIVSYFIWRQSGRSNIVFSPSTNPEEISAYGLNNDHGNILTIQPFLSLSNYASLQNFNQALDHYLAVAQSKGYVNSKTIAVFPEYIGTWLVTAYEKTAVYTAPDITKGMQPIVLCHILPFLKELVFASNQAKDTVKYSLFKVKAKTMAKIYHDVFSGLAKKYQITIVAGSIILPTPRLNQDRLETGDGKLYNITVVYQPDGKPYPSLVFKVFPTSSEIPFIAKGDPARLPIFQTPAGRLGVLICADAWYPAAYQALQKQNPDIIVVPSFKPLNSKFSNPWGGYDGYPAPDDVNLSDIGKITEEDALLKYSLPGRIASAGARYGVDVFLRGNFWDLGSDGYPILVNDGTTVKGKYISGAVLLNFWLP
ncbi:MAG TPA: nitrilase-related carbon-nitrogen hydrolase [Bacillota bacterium]|nr:nitrilase-related carbon-nitrogen hydrolase [Bacillota bacterium]